MAREIRKSIKWRPGPQKNNQRGPKNNQKWSKTIPKSTKMARRWAGGGRLAETPFLRFLGLFLTIFDCFLVLFDCFFGAQAPILLIFLFRASFFDCFWWFLIVFWLFFVIFIVCLALAILIVWLYFWPGALSGAGPSRLSNQFGAFFQFFQGFDNFRSIFHFIYTRAHRLAPIFMDFRQIWAIFMNFD